MATVVGICNRALVKLGVEAINSIVETSKEAVMCNLIYDDMRDELLTSHPWNFAIKRIELSLLATTPDYEFSHEYQLPTDCLRVLSAGLSGRLKYAVEEPRVLRCNSTTCNIKYISRVTTPGNFSRPFSKAFAWRMADEMCYALIQSASRAAQVTKLAEEAIALARSQDAQEGTPEQFIPDTWIDSRGESDFWED